MSASYNGYTEPAQRRHHHATAVTPDQALSHVVAQGGTHLGERGRRNVLTALRHRGYVVVHSDDVLDFLERISDNPLGTPLCTEQTPQEVHDEFMERFWW